MSTDTYRDRDRGRRRRGIGTCRSGDRDNDIYMDRDMDRIGTGILTGYGQA